MRDLQSSAPVLERRNLHNIWFLKTVRIVTQKVKGLLVTEALLLKGLHINLFTNSLTVNSSSGGSLKIARDIREGTKLTNFRVRFGTILSKFRSAGR